MSDIKQTDLSKRLRVLAKTLICIRNGYAGEFLKAAEEIERYYTGMLNWKATAEAKDTQLQQPAAVTPLEAVDINAICDLARHYGNSETFRPQLLELLAVAVVPAAPCKPAETVDTPEFDALMERFTNSDYSNFHTTRCATVAYIDAHTERAVAAAVAPLNRANLELTRVNAEQRLQIRRRDAARLDAFIDWYLRGGQRAEIHPNGHMVQTTRAIVIAALDAMATHPASSSDAAAWVALRNDIKAAMSTALTLPEMRKWKAHLATFDAAYTANGAQAGLSDEQIVTALHSLGVDTYPSKFGFSTLQVSATSVPTIRKLVELLAAPQKKEG